MRIAIVHDYLTQFGGAERVLMALSEIFPEAPIFTLLYNEHLTGHVFKDKQIHTSFLQKLPWSHKIFRFLPWLMPLAIEQFDLASFDVVISISTSYAKGILTKPYTRHISYCSTPPRYLWHETHESLDEFAVPDFVKPFIPMILSYLRVWDFDASSRVDDFIANSENVKQRIKKYYNRDSFVIHPPVEAEKFVLSSEPREYFLMVGRMVPYKRFDIVVQAFQAPSFKLQDSKLLIIGDGPERQYLKRLASGSRNIHFLGLVSDSKLPQYYARAKAVIFPQEEDFGIVPLEAMASGTPVIAYRAGGVLETVIEDKTGLFFDDQTPESLKNAIIKFESMKFDPEQIRLHALKWDKSIFQTKIKKYIEIWG
ncbi:MAG: glycosyltransferase [Parcubacteria group bacterium]|nr:glycosyltransferase [Parcubacteria group bacterium]